MTSNLAAQTLINEIGETGNISEATRKTVLQEVKAFFKPEFFNRVDDIVLFAPLQKSELEQIIELQLADIQKRLEERRITIDLDKESKDWLIARGYSPVYGARPLKRLLQKEVETLLAKAIITGEIADGSHVKISIESDRPVIVN
jgi:ATP-dependent Clp protease ATP-binding subunit ClpB